MKYFVNIAGMLALSAATVAGTSLWTSNVQAAEEETANAADDSNDSTATADDEGTTSESSEAIWRYGWRPYPGGFYNPYGYYRFRPYPYGYRYYRPYFYGPRYRGYYPYGGYYRGFRCGPYGCW